MASDIEVKNRIIVPCCMRDRTFGKYVGDARKSKSPVIARTYGDVTVKNYIDFIVDYAPGCNAVYVALPRLSRETIYQLRDLMRMDCKIDGELVKCVPKLYLFTRVDEDGGSTLMAELAESVFSAFGERCVVVSMEDVSQSVIALDHPKCPISVIGNIPIRPAQKSRMQIVTIVGDIQGTEWITKALRVAGKIKQPSGKPLGTVAN